MRVLLAALSAALLIGGPAAAITYTVNLTFNDDVQDVDTNPIFDDPILMTHPDVNLIGTITTDGTLGALTAANILGYRLDTTFDGQLRSVLPFEDQVVPGFFSTTDASDLSNFFATATELQVLGDFGLGGGIVSFTPFGAGSSVSTLSGGGGTMVLRFSVANSAAGSFGTSGFTASEALPLSPFVIGTAALVEPEPMSPIPLPASIWLMLAVLGAGALVARRLA